MAKRNDKGNAPKPGSKEWQDQLNKEIAEHDDKFARENPDWDEQHGGQK